MQSLWVASQVLRRSPTDRGVTVPRPVTSHICSFTVCSRGAVSQRVWHPGRSTLPECPVRKSLFLILHGLTPI